LTPLSELDAGGNLREAFYRCFILESRVALVCDWIDTASTLITNPVINGKLGFAKLARLHERFAALAEARLGCCYATAMQTGMLVRFWKIELMIDHQNRFRTTIGAFHPKTVPGVGTFHIRRVASRRTLQCNGACIHQTTPASNNECLEAKKTSFATTLSDG
jgi:hypothetical protein